MAKGNGRVSQHGRLAPASSWPPSIPSARTRRSPGARPRAHRVARRLGFDEAWVGEHHSAGYEIIASPELFIAAAAERTQHIRLGTGVVSLPYHNPLMVADRMIQLDHMTRGRVMLGVGPGVLPSDAMMLGIDPPKQRDMMARRSTSSCGCCAARRSREDRLVRAARRAAAAARRTRRPHLEVAVAASVTPSGPRTAGRYGISMLSSPPPPRRLTTPSPTTGRICEETAAEHGNWSSARAGASSAPMHVAETREQATRGRSSGCTTASTTSRRSSRCRSRDRHARECLEAMTAWGRRDRRPGRPHRADRTPRRSSRAASAPAPDRARLGQPRRTRRSYELIARYVMPRFQGLQRCGGCRGVISGGATCRRPTSRRSSSDGSDSRRPSATASPSSRGARGPRNAEPTTSSARTPTSSS